jgi:DNA-binding ferritin-like protein (Dps family)
MSRRNALALGSDARSKRFRSCTSLGDREEAKRMEALASALPGDRRTAYGEMTSYTCRSTTDGGMDVVAFLQGKPALEVTGEDVAAHCGARSGAANPFDPQLAKWRNSLDQDVEKHR